MEKWKNVLYVGLGIAYISIITIIVYKIEGYKTFGRLIGQVVIMSFCLPIIIGLILSIPRFTYECIKKHWSTSIPVSNIAKFILCAIAYIISGFILYHIIEPNPTKEELINNIFLILFLPAIPSILIYLIVYPIIKSMTISICNFIHEFISSHHKAKMLSDLLVKSSKALLYIIIIVIMGMIFEIGLSIFSAQ